MKEVGESGQSTAATAALGVYAEELHHFLQKDSVGDERYAPVHKRIAELRTGYRDFS